MLAIGSKLKSELDVSVVHWTLTSSFPRNASKVVQKDLRIFQAISSLAKQIIYNAPEKTNIQRAWG